MVTTTICGLCGKPYHGNTPCPVQIQMFTQHAGVPQRQMGWTCPVCGAGCAPWVRTHCGPKAQPVVVDHRDGGLSDEQRRARAARA